jgi:hypothetical protein
MFGSSSSPRKLLLEVTLGRHLWFAARGALDVPPLDPLRCPPGLPSSPPHDA